jgi:hypothetical protein
MSWFSSAFNWVGEQIVGTEISVVTNPQKWVKPVEAALIIGGGPVGAGVVGAMNGLTGIQNLTSTTGNQVDAANMAASTSQNSSLIIIVFVGFAIYLFSKK